ncbi:Chitin-binding protein [Phytophthora palmivora]|uniref:Chitin-binding protein n=1 Tax=Phytophthora palmivora TaxID=4796 RepID=A0A2P4YL00_9STRA|nr:Chitin-binding protein [Phytophthora palmivora]
MKPAVFCTLAGAAILLVNTVDAHGQMLVPSYRPITAKYRADCLYGLKGAGDDELQWAPIENLSQRGQADQPAAATFNMYNGCRGLVYESENNVTEIEAGKEFDVQYYIQAPHPGYMKLSIVKPSTDSTGKITYNPDTQIEYFSDFANSAGTFTVTATIPTNVTGCENAGDCALQFLWHSDIANQTYPTCADITIPGSGAGSSTSTSTTTASSTSSSSSSSSTTQTTTTAPTATTATPVATTKAPSTTTDDSEAAGEASYTGESTEASSDTTSTTDASADTTDASSSEGTSSTVTEAPTTSAPTTDAPETTSAPSTTSGSDKCSVRRRRVRQ